MNEQKMKITNEANPVRLTDDWAVKFQDVAENGTEYKNPFPNLGYSSNVDNHTIWNERYNEAKSVYSRKVNMNEADKLREQYKTENLLILGLREMERNNSSNNSIDLRNFINSLEAFKKENGLSDLQIFSTMFFMSAKIMAKEI